MKNQFLKKRLPALAMLVTTLLAPAIYTQQQRLGFLAAPATVQTIVGDQSRDAAESFLRTELYFGRNKPNGSKVSRKEWEAFLDEVITPRFPDGLTVLSGAGQFLGAEGEIEQERSVVLILLYPAAARHEKQAKIEEIREHYKRRFKQQSVLRMDDPQPVWVSF
jgi:hypothetical protein